MTPLASPEDFPQGQRGVDTQTPNALGGQITDRGQNVADAHPLCASVGSDSHDGHSLLDTHTPLAVVGQTPAEGASHAPTPKPEPRPLLDPTLALLSITLDDLERQRIAMQNRHRSLTTSGTSENGLEWGYGLDERDPQVATFAALVDQAVALEKDAVKALEKAMKRHPLGPWVAAQKGAGNKTVARLLGVIGDPYWHSAEDRPRTVSELWAYTGHKPGQRRRKGERANWSDDAKKRTYLIAAGFVKQLDPQCKRDGGIAEHQDGCKCSPYRKVYDARREHTREKVHAAECVRCGPSGKPAQPGTPWSPAHQMADAVRVTGKTFLKDLWREAKRVHEN